MLSTSEVTNQCQHRLAVMAEVVYHAKHDYQEWLKWHTFIGILFASSWDSFAPA